jgi:hypothetical protein
MRQRHIKTTQESLRGNTSARSLLNQTYSTETSSERRAGVKLAPYLQLVVPTRKFHKIFFYFYKISN